MKSCAICGSHAFNMAMEGVNQGAFCDRHYWQRKAEALESARATPALPQGDGRWEVVNRGGDGVSDIDLDGFTIALSVGDKFAHIIVNKMNSGAALPQGVEESDASFEQWVNAHPGYTYRDVWHGAIATAIPEGMAIVPVERINKAHEWADDIEDKICRQELTASQVFTRMRDLLYPRIAAAKEKGE